jgi:transposase
VKFLLTPGQTHDVTQADSMIEGIAAEHVLMDKGYDSDPLVAAIEKSGAKAVIPPRSNRKQPREYDREVYRERNKIERLFGRLKQCRRIATRYEKTARNFMAFLHLASAMIWLA